MVTTSDILSAQVLAWLKTKMAESGIAGAELQATGMGCQFVAGLRGSAIVASGPTPEIAFMNLRLKMREEVARKRRELEAAERTIETDQLVRY